MAQGTDGGGIQPQGQSLRNALRWLDDRVQDDPRLDRTKLVGEAAIRFDLTPVEEEFLLVNWVRQR
jgi:hypothetical protein